MIWLRSRALFTFYCWLGALLFSFYIVIDTQAIIGGKHRAGVFGEDEYIAAALNLYIDIVQLFMYILRLVGRK